MNDKNRIIVAVGSDKTEGLLAFAAQEATFTGRPLHLVHAMRMPPSLPESYAMAYQGAHDYGTEILNSAVARAESMIEGRVPVTSELVTDSGVVKAVVDLSASAQLVVLQHRHLSGLHRVASASTTHGVAAHSHAPVVSVPEVWRHPASANRLIVVGVHEAAGAYPLLRTAFKMANERGAAIRVVHTWWLSNGYDAVVVDDDMRAQREQRFLVEVASDLESVKAEFPDVVETISVRHAPAAPALLEAAHEADLLVLGRRHPTVLIRSHLGSVVRTVLRESLVPVMVVEPTVVAEQMRPRLLEPLAQTHGALDPATSFEPR